MDIVGRRNPSSGKENDIYQVTNKGNASSSPTTSEMTCIRNESPTGKEANAPDHPQISTLISENLTSRESDVPSKVSPVSEHDPEVPQYSLVHSAPSNPALLLPQVPTCQLPPFESNESQSREATRFPSIVPIKEAAHGNIPVIPANNKDSLIVTCLYLLLARLTLDGSIPSYHKPDGYDDYGSILEQCDPGIKPWYCDLWIPRTSEQSDTDTTEQSDTVTTEQWDPDASRVIPCEELRVKDVPVLMYEGCPSGWDD